MLNPFLYKWTVLFQTIQFVISTQFKCQNNSISSYSIISSIPISQTVLIQQVSLVWEQVFSKRS